MKVLVGIATLGVILRIRQFLHGRSMWLDEISLALSLREFGPLEILTTPLLGRQSAPPGYLLAAATSVSIFGDNDYGLRLTALASGIGSLILAVVIARRLLTSTWAQIGFVSLMALSPSLIYYSNEVKPYATDVLAICAVLLLWSFRDHPQRTMLIGVTGSVIAVISLPGIMGLIALGLALAIARFRPIVALLRIAALWLPGVGLHLVYILTAGTDRDYMTSWWGERDAFAPQGSQILSEITWYPHWLMRLGWAGIGETGRLGSTAATGPLIIGAILAVLTIIAAVRCPALRWILFLPILFALALNQFQMYPTSGRLSLYLIPVIFLIAIVGAQELLPRLSALAGPVMALAITPLLIIQATITIPTANTPLNDRNMKWAISHMEQHQRHGDLVVFERWSRQMQWYVSNDLRAATDITVLDADNVITEGIPADRHHWTYQRIWVTSTHRITQASLLTQHLQSEEGFTLICELTPYQETYLALLIRNDLISNDVNSNDVNSLDGLTNCPRS